MINLLNLKEETRKKLYKIIDIEKFRKYVIKRKASKMFLVQMHKDIRNLEKQDLICFVENALRVSDNLNKVTTIFIEYIEMEISTLFPHIQELIPLIQGLQFKDISDQNREKIKTYQEIYQQSHIPITYEQCIQLYCEITKDDISKIEQETYQKKINELLSKISVLESESQLLKDKIKTLRNELKESKKNIALTTKDITKITAENKKLNRLLEPDRLKQKIGELLKKSETNKSIQDLYEELRKKAQADFDTGNLPEVKKVLAAQYAIIKILEEYNAYDE